MNESEIGGWLACGVKVRVGVYADVVADEAKGVER